MTKAVPQSRSWKKYFAGGKDRANPLRREFGKEQVGKTDEGTNMRPKERETNQGGACLHKSSSARQGSRKLECVE